MSLISLKNKNTTAKLATSIKTSKDEGLKTRLRVILGIKKGIQRKEMAETLHLHVDTITDIVRRYNEKGIEGLKTNKGGRKEGNPIWDTSIFTDLAKEIDSQKKYWSLPLMVEWIKTNKQVEVPYQTVWYHLHKLNYSHKSARPHPYLGNKEKQDSFKKRALPI